MPRYRPPNPFRPVSPRDIPAALAGRVGAHRVLYVDERPTYLPSPYGDGRTFYYTRADGSEGVSWAEFRVNGHTFRRRVREVQIGNFGCSWVTIGGVNYQIDVK